MTTAQVGYTPVYQWVKHVLERTHTTVVVTIAWAVLCLLVAIAVGPPVTRRPPHRSRRAVFSHRALQKYSLPQVGLDLEGCLSRLGSSYDPWSGNFEAL